MGKLATTLLYKAKENVIPLISSAIFLVLLVNQVLVRPVTGLADNGDFIRFLMPFGIYTLDEDPDRQYGNWVNLKYEYLPTLTYKNETYSSERIFIFMAVMVNKLFSQMGYFDIRALGGLHLLSYWMGITIILFQTRFFERLFQAFLCAVILLAFSDVGYTQYLNSFYSEPMAIVTFTIIVGISMAISINPPSGRINGWIQAVLLIATCLLVTSKPPFSLFGMILIPWLLRGYFSILRLRKPVFAIGMIVVVLGCSLFSLKFSVPQIIKSANSYNTIFLGVLHRSPAPYEDLADLGFSEPQTMATFRGVSFWTPEIQNYYSSNENFQAEITQIGYFDIIRFYFNHPDRLYDLAKALSKYTFFMQVPYLGHYEIDKDIPPLSMVQNFHAWSDLRVRVLPGTLSFILILALLNIVSALFFRLCVFSRYPFRHLPELHLVVFTCAAVQYVATILGEGTADVVKHLFFVNMGLDLSLIFGLFYVVLLVKIQKHKGSSRQTFQFSRS